MNIALATRKTLIATLLVPMLAVTAVSVQSFAGMSDAHAQQTSAPGGPNGGGSRGSSSKSDPDNDSGLLDAAASNCPPGTTTHACPPPPRHLPPRVSSIEECSCHVTYHMVGGQRVAVKDCYVTLPNDKIAYCEKVTR